MVVSPFPPAGGGGSGDLVHGLTDQVFREGDAFDMGIGRGGTQQEIQKPGAFVPPVPEKLGVVGTDQEGRRVAPGLPPEIQDMSFPFGYEVDGVSPGLLGCLFGMVGQLAAVFPRDAVVLDTGAPPDARGMQDRRQMGFLRSKPMSR
jgi:hypothetical protein